MIGGGLAAAAIGSGVYARFGAIHRFVIERRTLRVPGLPAALDGVRIAQLSDLHIEPVIGAATIERAVAAVNALEPDLVALTGDFITDRADAIDDLAPLLAELRPRVATVASLGNHDVWHGAPRIRRTLEAHGIPVLVNEGETVRVDGEALYLLGLDSGWGGGPDMERSMAAHPPDAPVVALVHEPDLIDGVAHDRRVTLQLSGHSHGGQIRLPGLGAPVLPYLGRRYDQGLYRVGDTWLYTSRGLGVGGVPIRVNCPPEIAEITLIRGDPEAA
jgi:predicted MPP superfamily phosphohydrolase